MKSALTVVLFRLFTIGVFVDGNEASNVSVMEGDSVTLKSGLTGVQTVDDTEWRFKGNRIDKFVDGLQLNNQTGDLKISNIRTTDSGLYKVQISSTSGSSEMEFIVTVLPTGAAKAVILNEGDSVTIRTDDPEIQRVDEIRWRFGLQKSLVAEINRTAGIFNTFDGPDERSRDRLTLNNQTGSLNITNTTTTDSGLYEAEISSGKHTIHKSFNVNVSAGVKSLLVLMGDNVTLRTDLTEIQRDDQILWKFGDQDIARLIDRQTGDLTIKNIKRDQCGYYKVEINTTTMILHRKYQIIDLSSVKKLGLSLAVPDSGLSSDEKLLFKLNSKDAEIGGGVGVFLLVAAVAVGVFYCRHRSSSNDKEKNKQKVSDQVSEKKLMISEEHNSLG